MPVRVVTDTASSLGERDLARLAICTVPLHVVRDGDVLPESQLHQPGFYERLFSMPDMPGTSQPSPEEFVDAFRPLLEDGNDVLAALISAGMSGTVQSASVAAASLSTEFPDLRVDVLDTRSNSLEEGFAVLSAADAASTGSGLDSCRRAAEETMRRTRFLFTPHTLEYLQRGGRISGASALAGTILKVAPILTARSGTTGVAGAARGSRAVHRKIASLMRKDIDRCGVKRAAVQYVDDKDEATRFADEFIRPMVDVAIDLTPIHPVVGLHVGPAVGVVYETIDPLR